MKAGGHVLLRRRVRHYRDQGLEVPPELLREWEACLYEGRKLSAVVQMLRKQGTPIGGMKKLKGPRKAKVKQFLASKEPHPVLTKSVQYVYDEADNARLQAFYLSPEWRMARYEILRRDGAKCACCRTTEKPVVVDHIKPLRVFWHLRLDPKNLQVLCDDCNQGKGARHADNWR